MAESRLLDKAAAHVYEAHRLRLLLGKYELRLVGHLYHVLTRCC